MTSKEILHNHFTKGEIEFFALADLVEDIGYLADHNMLDGPKYDALMAKYKKLDREVARKISSKRLEDFRSEMKRSGIGYKQAMHERYLDDQEKRAFSTLLIEGYK